MKIRTIRRWSADNVRDMCINHRLYTRGDCRAYDKMLYEMVAQLDPTPRSLYKVSKDILDHSDPNLSGDDVTAIMFLLEKEAVSTFYEIDQ